MRLNLEQMRYFKAIILYTKGTTLTIALTHLQENPHKETLKALFKDFFLEFLDITQENFLELLQELEQESTLQSLLQNIQLQISKNSNNTKKQDSSIQKLIKFILQNALLKNASDIHFERDLDILRVRFRIDGVMLTIFNFESWLFAPLSTSIKLLAHLNLTEMQLPQDGRFSLELERNDTRDTFDFRVSILPLIEGESIVLRILDKHKTLLSMDALGFQTQQLQDLQKLFNLPFGLVFLTGPTGSGKSTTMYAMLNILKDRNLKIITLEDPVEYRLAHINQMTISPNIAFSTILRHILRQDPDVIILGEVRDKESLQLAIQASFTGHLVFATLHTNNAIDTISRLLDLGLEAYLIAQALSGIIAQRLLRRLCDCKEKDIEGNFYAKGCEKCNNTGYLGRVAIAEILLLDAVLEDFIRGKINKSETLAHLESKTKDYSFYAKANLLIQQGITDKNEVARVLKDVF